MTQITARSKNLIAGIILVWSLLPFIWIIANRPFNDIFVARTIADVKLSQISGGHLQFLWGAENHPSLESFVSILSQLFNIDPQALQFAPIGGVLRIVTLFALARRLLRSSVLGALVASTAAFDYSFGVSVNTLFTHAFGTALYFSFLLCYLMLLQKRALNTYLLLVAIFVGAYFFSYVASVWMIALLGFLLAIGFVQRHFGEQDDYKGVSAVGPSLFLAFLAAFVSFNQILYRAYLVNFLQRDYSLVFIRFLGGVLTPPSQAVLAYRTPIIWPLTALNVIYTATLLAIPATFVTAMITRRRTASWGRSIPPNMKAIFAAMILTGLLDSTLYFLYGFLDIKYVSIMFPLLSASILLYSKPSKARRASTDAERETVMPLSPRRWKRSTLATVFLIFVLVTNVARFGLAVDTNDFSRFSNTNAAPSSAWLLAHYRRTPAILADMSTLGKLDMYAAGLNRTITERFYNPFWFEYVVGSGSNQSTSLAPYADFLVVDQQASTRGTDTQLWSTLPPLAQKTADISAHPNLDLVYSDGAVLVFAVQP